MEITAKYLSVKQIMEATGLSRTTIHNLTNKGILKKTQMFGTRRVGYKESELNKLNDYTS
jgi:predicted DNA-binding transcriptional regulator AlpA